MTDYERLLQAIENVADTYGGSSGILLKAILKEVKRLKRIEEWKKEKEQQQRFEEAYKEKKVTGSWPDWFNKDDDIPF